MNILFVTENSSQIKKASPTFENLRTDMAWIAALDATHANLNEFRVKGRLPDYLSTQTFSVAVVILPKMKPGMYFDTRPFLENIRAAYQYRTCRTCKTMGNFNW